ncbi:hypothetical protein ASG43_12270 [Aureimonas sp. Leaf454]|nr:hypothetical protein ASG43_12270 [Aureimonas sp. Leaf454]
MTTRFECDPAKSASNLVKHGIDVEEAKRLWQDPRFFVSSPKRKRNGAAWESDGSTTYRRRPSLRTAPDGSD